MSNVSAKHSRFYDRACLFTCDTCTLSSTDIFRAKTEHSAIWYARHTCTIFHVRATVFLYKYTQHHSETLMPSTANKMIQKKGHSKKETGDATDMHCWKGFEKKGVQVLPSGKKANICKPVDNTSKFNFAKRRK